MTSILVASVNGCNMLASRVGSSAQCQPVSEVGPARLKFFDNRTAVSASRSQPRATLLLSRNGRAIPPVGAKSLVLNILTSNSFGWNILQGKFFSWQEYT